MLAGYWHVDQDDVWLGSRVRFKVSDLPSLLFFILRPQLVS